MESSCFKGARICVLSYYDIMRFNFLFCLLICCLLIGCSYSKLNRRKILKVYNKSSLKGNLLALVKEDEIVINRYGTSFRSCYVGDFNNDKREDLLCGFNINYGCDYQFLISDFKNSKTAYEVKKINNQCGFYSYIIPSDEGHMNVYFLENDSLKVKEVYMYKNFFLERELRDNWYDIDKVEVELRYHENKARWLINKSEVVENNDYLNSVMYLFSKIDFSLLKRNSLPFIIDAPVIWFKIIYQDGSIIEFTDQVNFLSGRNLYDSLALTSLYELVFYEYYRKDY